MAERPNRNGEMNAIQRDRMERRKNTRRKSMISTTVFVVAAVAVLGLLIFGAVKLLGSNKDNNNTVAVNTTVDATIASGTVPAATQAQGIPATQPSATTPAGQTVTPTSPSQYAADPAWQTPTEAGSDTQTPAATENGSYINDENVYIDQKHPAPEGTGNSVQLPISGHVDGDFYWTYDADNGNCSVSCDYDFANQQYIFHIYGASPGTTNLTLYYSDNGSTLSTNVTISVDDNLNATQI